MIESKIALTEFSAVDSSIFEVFNSPLYDGVWYSEKANPCDFVIAKSFNNLLGFQPCETLSWRQIIHPDHCNLFQNILSTFIGNGNQTHTQDLQLITKDGDIVWMHCQLYTKCDTDNDNQFIFLGFKKISESQIVEKKITQRKARINDILNGTSIGTWEYNLITGESIWNESLAQIVGYTLKDFEGSKFDLWYALTHPEDAEKSQQLFDQHIATNSSSFSNEIRMKHKDGHWVWVQSLGKVISFSPNGKPEWFGGVVYDISDRKNGEILVKKYKDLLEGVNQAAQIGIWEVNFNDNQIYCSDEIKSWFGIPLEYQISLNETVGFFKEGESRQKLIKAVENAITKGENYDIEIEAIGSNKKTFWTRSIGISEFKNGRCVRFFGFFQNIHDKTIATRELASKEELFRKTFTHAPVGMAIINLKGNISRVNRNLCEFLGYTKKQLSQKNFNKFSHPEDKNLTDKLIEELLRGSSESFKLDKRYIHCDGNTVWGQVSVSSVRNEMKKITHFVVQVQDITERKKNELLLINYKDLLERSNHVAKIGSWEINVNDQTVSWSKSLGTILNTRDDLKPTFNESINYFTSDTHKVVVKMAMKNALTNGKNFDIELLVNTENDGQKWIRMIGISEFENGECERLYGLIQDINDIMNAQLAITDKEEQWRTTFNHAKSGIALINFNGMADNVNKSMCDIFGYSMTEMQQVSIKDISLPEDLEHNIGLMNNLIRGFIDDFTDEKRFRHKKGHTIWTNVSVSAVKNDYNQFTHMVAQIVDITESKTNEILLKKYKNILERSNEVARIGSWEMDPITHILFWSENLGRLLGNTTYKPDVLNDSIINYVLEDEQQHLSQLISDAIQYGKNFDLELQLKTTEGPRWMRMIGISEFENDSCKLLHGLVQDIDEFKKAELEIQLREEEFRQTFWHAPIGMAIMDLKGKIVRVNPGICETFGYTEQEMIAIENSVISHPEDAEITHDFMQEILNGTRESFQQEKRYFHKNKNLIWAVLSMSSVKNDKGETTHFVTQVNDITDKKLLTESLKEHNNRLQNYAHIVSHNLRSHTGNLSMLLELSEIDHHPGFDNELFEHIKSASGNMNETVNHLSEIVEIQNFIKDTLVPHNLRKRVKKSLQNVQATLNQINGEIVLKVNKDFMVYAVASYLDSIILNLLTNAIKYRSPNRLLKIKIKAGKKNDHTYLSITDNGLGIDMETHGSKVFGMYKTFHDHKNARGIGLFISKNQIEAMGGTIEVESEPNVGSTFTIQFNDEKN